jgi:hypothetical protein
MASREAPDGPWWDWHGWIGPGSGTCRGSAGRGRAWRDQGRAVWSGAGRGRGGSASRLGDDGGNTRAMREREVGERKVRPGYYTRLCSSGQHFSQRP